MVAAAAIVFVIEKQRKKGKWTWKAGCFRILSAEIYFENLLQKDCNLQAGYGAVALAELGLEARFYAGRAIAQISDFFLLLPVLDR